MSVSIFSLSASPLPHGPTAKKPVAIVPSTFSRSGVAGSTRSPANLIDDEAVVGQIAIHRPHDPIAIPPGSLTSLRGGSAPGRGHRHNRYTGPRRASAGPNARHIAGEASSRSTTLANASGDASARKACTSAGVGGRPVKSNVARRISVRRSAAGACRRWACSSRARM